MKHGVVGLILSLIISFLDIYPAFSKPPPTNEEIVKNLSTKIEQLDRKELTDLAKAYSALGDSTGAIKAYTAILALAPKSPETLTAIGAEQIKIGRETEAKQTLKTALEVNKKYLPAYRQLIKLYEKKNNNYELRMIYMDLVSFLGKKPEYITNLCALTTDEGLYDQAKSFCESGMILAPVESKNFVNLGLALRETGKTAEAEIQLKSAATQFPKSEFAQLVFAQDQEQKKNYVVAYNYYKKTLALNSSSLNALQGLAKTSFEIQKFQEALDNFTRACSLDAKTVPAFKRATNSLRLLKNEEWLPQFDAAQQLCRTK